MLIDTIYERFIQNNGFLTTKQLMEIGISKTTITNYVKAGLLIRCGHGLYTMPDSIEDDMYLLMMHSKYIIFSHETALFLNALSDRTPFIHAITIPSNTSLAKDVRRICKCYYIDEKYHKLGMIEVKNTFGNKVRCYDAERTICDILRNKNRIDEETVVAAIKNYSRYRCRDLNKLGVYAKTFNVFDEIRKYMGVLL